MKNYLINHTCTFKGEWWHSSDDTTRFAGELEYAPQEDKVELVIWGASELLQIDFYNDTFLGETTDGLKLTLTHLQRSHSTGTISQNPKYVHTVQVAGAVIIGMHFNKIEDIRFSCLAICFTDQNLFIQRNGFEINLGQQTTTIDYAAVDGVQLYSDNLTVISLSFTYTTALTDTLSQEARIVQREYFHMEATQGSLDYRSIVERMTMLRDFLTFSINKNVYVEECYFYDYEPAPDKVMINLVHLLDRTFWKSSLERNHHTPQNVMFTLGDIESGRIQYCDWIAIYQSKKSAIEIFFGLKYRRETFLEEVFLELMHILEDYHRHSPSFRQCIESETKFENKIAEIINACPEKYKKWLKKSLKHTNEINLQWRINDILKLFDLTVSRLIPDTKVRNKTVEKMVASRNYLIHRSERAKEKSIQNYHNFFYLNDLIRIMMTMLIMTDLGLTLQEIDNKMYCVPEFVHRMHIDWKGIE